MDHEAYECEVIVRGHHRRPPQEGTIKVTVTERAAPNRTASRHGEDLSQLQQDCLNDIALQ